MATAEGTERRMTRANEIKTWRSAFFCLLLMVVLLIGFNYRSVSQSIRNHQATMGSVADSTGRLVELFQHVAAKSFPERAQVSMLHDVIRKQALVLVVGEVDVANLDAISFAGICRLVSARDQLFAPGRTSSPSQIMDDFLNKQLKRAERLVMEEYKDRSRNSVSKAYCPGFSRF
jgi:hypothetical protein